VQVVFAGICCWVDSPAPKQGKTVIVRNALNGGSHQGSPIPPHTAFIHAKRNDVDAADWPVNWAGADDNLLFWLTGEHLSFDPAPNGGAIDITLIPHVRDTVGTDPICPRAGEIRPGFLANPTSDAVLALVELPPEADVHAETNAKNAIYATLTIPDAPVTITATPFDGGPSRSLVVTNPEARVFIANVSVPEYLLGVGAEDDDHKYLVCEIFRPVGPEISVKPVVVGDTPAPRRRSTPMLASIAPLSNAHAAELDRVSLSTFHNAANRGMRVFLDTLAGGCSDSQWP